MCLAVQVEHRSGGICSETERSVLMAHAVYIQVVPVPFAHLYNLRRGSQVCKNFLEVSLSSFS